MGKTSKGSSGNKGGKGGSTKPTPNLPSKTGLPSGKGRGNNLPKR